MTKVTRLTLDDGGNIKSRRIHLREISGDSDAPLETVGQDLRAARLRRGDDLATVSKSLKIRKDHLEAIEEDRLEALPGRTYAIGFVRSYADYLGLDAVQAVERFKGEIAGRSDGTHPIALAPETEERRLPHGWAVVAVVLLVVVAYGAYHLAKSADSLLKGSITSIPVGIQPQASTAGTNGQMPIPTPAATPAARNHSLTAQPPPSLAATGAGTLPQAGVASKGTAGTNAATANMPPASQSGSNGSAAGVAASPVQTASLPGGQEYGAQNIDARVILRAKSATRVLVQGADGTVFINRVLRQGDSYRVPDKVGLTLTTPDGGDVGLELDGQEMGTAGSQGQVTEALSLDPQSIVDHFGGGEPR